MDALIKDLRFGLRQLRLNPTLIACANLANLLLARASVREREIAVRQAVGASRGRLITQLLSESLLLAIAGTVLGAVMAQALSRALVAFLSTQGNTWFVGLQLDPRLLGFMAGVAILTCLLFGLAPAIRATNITPASAMRSGGRGITTGRERFGLRRILVVAQVSLSLALLVGAFLFVRSLQKLLDIQPGFRPEGILAVSLDLRLAGAFGLLAGSLAVLGLYGVVAYMVARRRNEIGVRIALGAGRARVVGLVLKEAAVLVAVGLAVGIALSLWAARAATAMLYGLKPYDPVTLAGAAALLAGVALIASYAPARRASRLDPMDALREE